MSDYEYDDFERAPLKCELATFVVYDHGDHDKVTHLENDDWISAEAQDTVNKNYGATDEVILIQEALGCLWRPNMDTVAKGYLFVTLRNGTQDTYSMDLDGDEIKKLVKKGDIIKNEKISKSDYELTYDPMPWWWMDSLPDVDCHCEEVAKHEAKMAGYDYDYDNSSISERCSRRFNMAYTGADF